MVTALVYGFLVVGFALSWKADRQKTLNALRVARRAFIKMLPSLIAIVGLVGLIVGLVPPETIGKYLGEGSGLEGTLVAALVGAITLIPSIIAFPLAASLLRQGATVLTIAAFISTLTMVGVVTAPLEAKELGWRFMVVRNALSFMFALVIAVMMGVIL